MKNWELVKMHQFLLILGRVCKPSTNVEDP